MSILDRIVNGGEDLDPVSGQAITVSSGPGGNIARAPSAS